MAVGRFIYLDYCATHPLDEVVREAMMATLNAKFGHPGSRAHRKGWEAEAIMDRARASVATLIGSKNSEVVFTSGGTESCVMAIVGAAKQLTNKGCHLVTSAVEHPAVRDTHLALEKEGFEITWVGVDEAGRVRATDVADAIRSDTTLVTIQLANHETGCLQPVQEIGDVCRDQNVWFHVDACLGMDTIQLDVDAMPIDLLSMTAHKMSGPKGIGALYVRRRDPRVTLMPLLGAGGQERGRRGGTPNLPGIAGLGAAADLVSSTREQQLDSRTRLQSIFEQALCAIEGAAMLSPPQERLAGVTNISFSGVTAEALLMGVSEVAFSSGAACASANLTPSHVLAAMNVPEARREGSVRFSIGRETTEDELREAADRIALEVGRLQALDVREKKDHAVSTPGGSQ